MPLVSRIFILISLFIAAFGVPQLSSAQFELNEAQRLIYLTAHFEMAPPGTKISYEFERTGSKVQDVDRVELTVTDIVDGKNDIELEFLSGENAINFPPFQGYKGNPVIIAFLERDVREMSKTTGGGNLYFRNRIRHGLAGDVSVAETQFEYDGTMVPAILIEFKPYENAPLRERLSYYADKTYQILLSSAIPGYVAYLQTFVVSDEYELQETLSINGVVWP